MKYIETENNDKYLLRAKEVANCLGIGISTVYAYADKGILKPVYMPSILPSKANKRNRKSIRFRVDVVEEFAHNLQGWSSKEDEDAH